MSVMFCDVELPDDFVMAQESRNIVYFVGAGVSCNAGLPDAKELLRKIERRIGVRRDDSRQLFKKGYEFYYEKLQRQYPNLKDEVRKILMPRCVDPVKLQLHNALLKLSYNNEGNIKIITTNFDDFFQRAAKQTGVELKSCYSAPLLPPCNTNWHGLIHLHGRFPRKSENGGVGTKLTTVLTLSDYGYAYMTNGYASDFLVELFRTHTVCFVGYSADENVIKYILSAIASDLSQATFSNPIFTIDTYKTEKERVEKYNNWMEQNVTPILVENRAGDFKKHTIFFEKWSEFVNSQSLIKKKIAKDEMEKGEKANVNLLAWALCDKIVASEIFKNESSSEAELLTILKFLKHPISRSHEKFAVLFSKILYSTEHSYSLFLRENEFDKEEEFGPFALEMEDASLISKMLAKWLANFIKNDALFDVVSNHYPNISSGLLYELEKVFPCVKWKTDENYKFRFWRYVLEYAQRDYSVKQELAQGDVFNEVRGVDILSEEDNLTTRRRLKEIFALRCYPKVERSYWDEHIYLVSEIGFLENWYWQERFKSYLPECNGMKEVPSRWLGFFEVVLFQLSDRVFRLEAENVQWKLFRDLRDLRDNEFKQEWMFLISLLRQAWVTLLKENPSEALRIIHKWMALEYPIFQFVVFGVINQSHSIVPLHIVISWLLKDNCKIFLNTELSDEIECFIKNNYEQLSGDTEVIAMLRDAVTPFYENGTIDELSKFNRDLLTRYLLGIFENKIPKELNFLHDEKILEAAIRGEIHSKIEVRTLRMVSRFAESSNSLDDDRINFFVTPKKRVYNEENGTCTKSQTEEWREFVSCSPKIPVIREVFDKCKDKELLKDYRRIFFDSFKGDNSFVWSYILEVGVSSLVDILDLVLRRVYLLVKEFPTIDTVQLYRFLEEAYNIGCDEEIEVEEYEVDNLSKTAFSYIIRVLWVLKKKEQDKAQARLLLKRLLASTLTCKNKTYRGVVLQNLQCFYSWIPKWIEEKIFPLLRGENDRNFYWRCFLSTPENRLRIKNVLEDFLMMVNSLKSERFWKETCLISLFDIGLCEKNVKAKQCARFKLKEVLETELHATTLIEWLMKEMRKISASQKRCSTFFFDVFSCRVYGKIDANIVIQFVFCFKHSTDAILQFFIKRNLIDFRYSRFYTCMIHSYDKQVKEFVRKAPAVFYNFVLAIYKSKCLASGYDLKFLDECLTIACDKDTTLRHAQGYEAIQGWLTGASQ